MNALKPIITVIGLVAPLMYFHGQAFYQGRLSYWGLPVDLFPLLFEQALVYGYLSYTLMGIPALLSVFIFLLIAVATLNNLHELTKFSWVRKVIGWIFQRKITSDEGHALTGAALTLSIKISGAVMFLLVFLFTVVSIYGSATALGRETAANQHRDFLESDKPSIVKSEGNAQFDGYPIACSQLVCAFLTNNQVQVVPNARILSIERPGPDEPNAKGPLSDFGSE